MLQSSQNLSANVQNPLVSYLKMCVTLSATSLKKICATYTCEAHPSTSYAPPTPVNQLSFFPSLPLLRGPGRYQADLQTRTSDEDDCKKCSYGHPSLTPGIFTVYCIHSICYGFEVMCRCESPQVSFSIFTSRFEMPPKTIVYDNACKLHVYCLNREPALYKNTRFFVDRFHWKGHVGCSRGYSLESYASVNTKKINSQVNEQANSGLQRIKAQLAYMKPDNFLFTLSLFLSIINVDKIKSVDVSQISTVVFKVIIDLPVFFFVFFCTHKKTSMSTVSTLFILNSCHCCVLRFLTVNEMFQKWSTLYSTKYCVLHIYSIKKWLGKMIQKWYTSYSTKNGILHTLPTVA